MPQISHRLIKKETETKMDQLLLDAVGLCTHTTAVNFLEDLLTPTEHVMLAKRLSIAYLLEKGYPYKVISSTVKVSTTTVGSVARMLSLNRNGVRDILTQIENHGKWKLYLEELVDTALHIMGTGKGANWANTKAYERARRMIKNSPLS
jgi:uncharacterized protein YerC